MPEARWESLAGNCYLRLFYMAIGCLTLVQIVLFLSQILETFHPLGQIPCVAGGFQNLPFDNRGRHVRMTAEIKNKAQEETEDEKAGSKEPAVEKRAKNTNEKKKVTTEALQEKLALQEKEAKETYDRFLRVSAEFENYKKRSTREMSDFRKYANEAMIKELLPVIDSLERALNLKAGEDNHSEDILAGVELTLKELLKILEKSNVKPIDALGQTFDPNFHQAVMQQESGDHPEQTVIEELQKGYMIYDRLLRAAMVVVSK